mmetsp:Transcript_33457/g.65253  ORF Transcript_33457/g.65253 Transcript_33457/m.65253 type:complete len:228 (-) Transcript_33457:511-1194(-)
MLRLVSMLLRVSRIPPAASTRCSDKRLKSLLSDDSRCSASVRAAFSLRRSSCSLLSSCSMSSFSVSALLFTSFRYSTRALSLSWICASVSRIHSDLLWASRSRTSRLLRYSSALRSACSASRRSSSLDLLFSSIFLTRASQSTLCCTKSSLHVPRSCLWRIIVVSAMRRADRSHSFSSLSALAGSTNPPVTLAGCGGGSWLNISCDHVVPSMYCFTFWCGPRAPPDW